jgi:hypothetical protein
MGMGMDDIDDAQSNQGHEDLRLGSSYAPLS